jgi:hypothetical protein
MLLGLFAVGEISRTRPTLGASFRKYGMSTNGNLAEGSGRKS